MKRAEKNKQNCIGRQNAKREIVSLAIPAIIAMVVGSLQGACDAYFLARLGVVAISGICYPAIALLQGCVMTFAFGSANNISASIGKGDFESAEGYFSVGYIYCMAFCIVVGGIFGIFATQIVAFCGGGGNTWAVQYLSVQCFGLVAYGLFFFLSASLRAQGGVGIVMFASFFGVCCNLLFNIIAEKLSLGVVGVSVGTAMAYAICGGILAVAILCKKSTLAQLKLQRSCGKLWRILAIGGSSFFRQSLGGLSAIVLNYVCGKIGGEVLAGATIASKITLILFAVALGLGQGMQPVLAFWHGRGDGKKEKIVVRFSLLLAIVIGSALGILLFVLSGKLATIVGGNSSEGVEIATATLRFSSVGLPFSFVGVSANMALQSLGKATANILVAMLRQGVVYIPTLLVLSWVFKTKGVITAHMISDIVAGVVAGIFLLCQIKVQNKNGKNSKSKKSKFPE